jgi:hypothetical protein
MPCPEVIFEQYCTGNAAFELLVAGVVKSSVYWDTTLCCPLKVNRRFRENPPLPSPLLATITLISYLAYSTLKMEMIYSSETPIEFQRIAGRYIPKDRTLRDKECHLLRCYAVWLL